MYAALTWLWWRALRALRDPAWAVLLAAAALAVLYGATDEVHQHFVPTRNGRIADVVLDAAGTLMMVLGLRRVAWLRR